MASPRQGSEEEGRGGEVSRPCDQFGNLEDEVTEPQVDVRGKIEAEIAKWEKYETRRIYLSRDIRMVRAALAAYDEDHHSIGNDGCKCLVHGWPCPTKSSHEAALWKAISGEGV